MNKRYKAKFISVISDDFGYEILKNLDFNMDRSKEEGIYPEDVNVRVFEFETMLELIEFLRDSEFSFDYDSTKARGLIIYEDDQQIFVT